MHVHLKTRKARVLARAAAGGAVIASALALALPASAITGPFTWGYPTSASWCPAWHGQNGCNTVQTQSPFTNNFDPAQVSVSGSGSTAVVNLAMNSGLTSSGAVSTRNGSTVLESYSLPFTITEKINTPCVSGATVDWPAFWLARVTAGSIPGQDEIDVAEGSHGHLAATYHYPSGTGLLSATTTLTGPNGFPCGSTGTGGDYNYKVHEYLNGSGHPQVDFSVAGVVELSVAKSCSSPCKSMGVDPYTGAYSVINDFATGSNGSVQAGSKTMFLKSWTTSNS